MICIHRDVLGTDRHLLAASPTSGFQWTDDVPANMWTLGPNAKKSISSLMEAHGMRACLVPTGSHLQAASVILGTDPVPGDIRWQYFMPPATFKAYVRDTVTHAFEVMSDADIGYSDLHQSIIDFVNSFEPVTIDTEIYEAHLDENASPALRTFHPDANSIAPKIVYTKSHIRTGRLSVVSGPDILTLPRQCRNIMRPRPGNAMAYIDYSSMEPRFLLALIGRYVEGDLYRRLGEAIGRNSLDRNVLKLLTTSTLYGAGTESIAKVAKCGLRTADEIHRHIVEFFALDDLQSRLEDEQRQHGFIRNFYGRRVYPDTSSRNTLINNFGQSSAADAAILGFMPAAKQAGVTMRFVLHDASFVEVDSVTALKAFVKTAEHIQGISVRMPLTVTRI